MPSKTNSQDGFSDDEAGLLTVSSNGISQDVGVAVGASVTGSAQDPHVCVKVMPKLPPKPEEEEPESLFGTEDKGVKPGRTVAQGGQSAHHAAYHRDGLFWWLAVIMVS